MTFIDFAEPSTRLEDLSNLEKMGAFCSSQIHDLNNQMACLFNTGMFLETCSEEVPESLREVLAGLGVSVQRLSVTVEAFNAARRLVPLQKTWMGTGEIVETLRGTLSTQSGWMLRNEPADFGQARAEPRWLAFVLQQLLKSVGSEMGTVTLDRGPLPQRNYVRTPAADTGEDYLLLHFENGDLCDQPKDSISRGGQNHSIALELLRLMGASVSFGRSDQPDNVLLALRSGE